MKKTFLAITALAAMLFAGCTSSDELTTLESIKTADNTPTPVQFGTYIGKSGNTRAGVAGAVDHITTTTLQTAEQGFGVFAFYNNLTSAEGASITHNAAAEYGSAITEAVTPNFMYNQKVTYETDASLNKWVYNPVKYWPNDFAAGNVDGRQPDTETSQAQGSVAEGKLSFFAYAPYVAVTTNTGVPTNTPDYGITQLTSNTTTKDPIVSYKFKNTASAESALSNVNVDLLWGLQGADNYSLADGTNSTQGGTKATSYNVNLTKEKAADNVNFLFKHALSNVGGRMSTDANKSGVKVILDIDGNSGDNQATYFGTGNGYNLGNNLNTSLVTIESINITDIIENSKSTLYTEGKFDIANGKWSTNADDTKQNGATDAHYVNITYDDELAASVLEPTTATLSYSSGWKVGGNSISGVTTSVQDALTAALHPSIYLIPGNSDQKLRVTITYYVRTFDANLAGISDAHASGDDATHTWTKVKQIITNDVTLPSSLLASNKYITLVIHLGLTSVKFAASVAEWGDSNGDGTPDANADKLVWLPSNVVPAP